MSRPLYAVLAIVLAAGAAAAQPAQDPPATYGPQAPMAAAPGANTSAPSFVGGKAAKAGKASMTPEQRAQKRAAKQAKLAAMTPAQREAHEQKKAARRAAKVSA